MKEQLTDPEMKFLKTAVADLEFPGVFTKMTQMIGQPIIWSLDHLPLAGQELIHNVTYRALETALLMSVRSLERRPPGNDDLENILRGHARTRLVHSAASVAGGLFGGAFGFAGMAIELPWSTTVMLRGIASTAQDFGEDMSDPHTKMQCLSIFAFGHPAPLGDSALESSYYATRLMLAEGLREAARFLAGKSVFEVMHALRGKSTSVLADLVLRIAMRFNVVVTKKAMAEAIPVLGAVGGASINMLFIHHFIEVARYHFGLRFLERRYGKELIKQLYDEALAELRRDQPHEIN